MENKFISGKLLFLTIVVLCLSIFNSCKEENEKTRTKFKPGTSINDQVECSSVECVEDPVTGEVTCKTINGVALPANSVCYDVVIPIAPSSGSSGGSTPPDTLGSSLNSTFSIDSSGESYGFDYWLDYSKIDDFGFEKRKSYLSVKNGGKVSANLHLSTSIRRLYSSFILEIDQIGEYLSFDSTHRLDTIEVSDSLNIVELFGKREEKHTPIPINVYGISRNGSKKALVCDSCIEALEVLCYDERSFDTLRIYRVNSPSYNPSDSVIKQEFNSVLKQAVLNVSTVKIVDFDSTSWDNNGNGVLDLFPIRDSVPLDYLEHERLIESLEDAFPGCNSCYNEATPDEHASKIMMLPGKISRNWLVSEEVDSGSREVTMQYEEHFIKNLELRIDSLSIGPWGRSAEKIERFVVNSYEIDDEKGQVTLKIYGKDFAVSHEKGEMVFKMGSPIGLTIFSCSWIQNTNDIRTLIHEYLHMQNVGPLAHSKQDTTNIMFPFANLYGKQLRYREVVSDNLYGNGSYERQWQALQQ